ncbi:TolC family protein [Persephonella sp.]|uniref:TolC family protein n=1 Tax=Persephonella sp. TaxID=2060922 RepID=UPI0025E75012|nr:TolC family protein [Persephonella sp.]
MRKILLFFLIWMETVFSMDLDTLINQALKNSPYISEKRIDLKIGKVTVEKSKRKKLGQIDLYGSFNRYEDPRILYPISTPVNIHNLTGAENQIIAGISYTVPIFTGFKIKRNIQISKISKKIKEIDLLLSEQMVVFNIRSIYLKILSLEKQLVSAKAYRTSLEKLKNDIQEAVNLGRKPEIDLYKVQYRIEDINYKIERIQNSIKNLKAAVKTLVGDQNIDLSNLEDIKPAKNIVLDKEFYIKKIKKLKKIKKIDLSKEISYQKMLTIKGECLPEIYFKASAQRNMGNSQYKDLWQVGIFVNYKLFDFGVRRNRYIQSKLDLEKKKIQKKKTELELIKDIDEAINRIKTYQAKIKASEKKLKYARSVEQAEKAKYEEGVSDLYNYLYAKAERFSAQAEYYDAVYNREIAIFYLKYLLEEQRYGQNN